MKRMLLLATAWAGLAGCSLRYAPGSEWEARELRKAQLTLYPSDVRARIGDYRDRTVAWTGVIVSHEITEADSRPTVELYVEHHYYDWVVDNGLQTAKFLLSPRGEGRFRARWRFKAETSREDIARHSRAGEMVIVYGTPAEVVGDSVLLQATYIRLIEKPSFSVGDLDYGRTDKRPGD